MSNLEPPNPPIEFEPSAETLLRDAEAHIRRLEAMLAVAGIAVPKRIPPVADTFGAHITDGNLGSVGHVILSEDRYQWLLAHVDSDAGDVGC